MIEEELLTYITLDRFRNTVPCDSITSSSAVTVQSMPWKEMKRIVDKVHRNVCGDVSYSDFKMLLKRKNIQNDIVDHYIKEKIRNCKSCHASELPPPSRKVSISLLSTELKEVVCVDHLSLDDLCLVHFMDLSTSFSTTCIVENKSIETAMRTF